MIFPRLDLREAATVRPPPEDFVFADFPFDVGLYGMLIGPDGARKSWVALHIAIGVAAGLPIAGGLWPAPQHSGRVVYYAGEDPRRQLRNRYWAIAHQQGYENISDLDDRLDVVPVLDMPEGIALLNQTRDGIERTSWVEKIIEHSRGARLVILDPLADLMGGVEENSSQVGMEEKQTLRLISREVGCPILIAHHQSKFAMQNGAADNQSARGSSVVPAGARWSMICQPIRTVEELLTVTGEGKFGTIDIAERERRRWTRVVNPKNSYGETDNNKFIYHYQNSTDTNGDEIPGAPLVRDIHSCYGQKQKPQHVRRGLANVVGSGADEFDQGKAEAERKALAAALGVTP